MIETRLGTSGESRTAEAATIAWMLATTMALGLVVTAGLSLLYAAQVGPQADGLAVFARLLLIAALVSGLVDLVLIPVVHRLRVRRPPPSITAAATLIGLAPVLAAAWYALRG